MARVIIIGGHGKVALLAAPLLVENGHEVTSVFRNADHTDDVEAAGATPRVADVEHLSAEEIAALVRGHDVLVWSAGAGGGDAGRTYAVDRDAAIRSMDAASLAGVEHYVMVSYYGAGKDHGVPEDNPFFAYAEAKAGADEHLRETDLSWTILGPSTLTLDEPTGSIDALVNAEGPAPTEPGTVSRGNVARVIAGVVDRIAVGRSLGDLTVQFVDGSTPIDEVLDDAAS